MKNMERLTDKKTFLEKEKKAEANPGWIHLCCNLTLSLTRRPMPPAAAAATMPRLPDW